MSDKNTAIFKKHTNIKDFDIKDKLFLKVFNSDDFKKMWELNMTRTKQFINYTLKEKPKADNINKKYLKYLSKMNSLGFITTDSQSDLQKIAVYPETKDYLKKDPKNATSPHIIKYILFQRPYVEGFIPLKIYSQFVEELDNISKFCYSIDLLKDDYNIVLTDDYTKYSDNTIVCEPYNRLMKEYITDDIRDEQIELLGTVDENSYGGGVEGLTINKDEWVYVIVIDTRTVYDVEAPSGLFVSIIKALEESLKKMNKNIQNRNRNFNKTAKNPKKK